jgi:lactate permease
MMDVTGAITRITAYIRSIAAERYEQIMILNVGFGSFLVSIGATPVTMLPPIMLALGFSPIAAVALPCLGYDPLTSFSLLAVPITLPAAVFNLDAKALGINIALFLPVMSTGIALGMLWVADGIDGVKKGFFTAVTAGLTLGISAIVFVNILPVSAIGLVGVFSGLVTIAVLFLLRACRRKVSPTCPAIPVACAPVAPDNGMPLWKAAFPWVLLVFFAIIISIPLIQGGLYNLLGGVQKIPVVANKVVDLKLLNQAYFWVLVSTILSAPLLIRTRGEARTILRVWLNRAWSPTLAAMVFFAIAYVMDWSGQSVINNTLMFAEGASAYNMNAVIGLSLALFFGVTFPVISPTLGLLGSFISGSEASSNIMFYGILKTSTDVLSLDFLQVYAAHAVAGGVASGIAVAKIINAAAVIDKLGIEGEVIRKVAPVVIALTIIIGLMLALMLAFS